MDDPDETVRTLERVADEYVRRHADRTVVADPVDRFLATVDGVRACASLLHVLRSATPGTLAEFSRVPTPGETPCLSVNRDEGRRDGDAYADDRRSFALHRRERLRHLLEEAGLERIEAGADDRIRAPARC